MNYYNLTGQVNDQDTSAIQTLQPKNLIACAENAVSALIQVLNQILANPLNPANLTNFLLAVTKFTVAVTLSCPVNVATQLINCINSNGFNNIPGILDCINAINTETVLRSYITSGSNTVSVCTVDSTTGALDACQDAGGSGFNLPYGIAIDAKSQHAYFANYLNDTVSVCTIKNTGQLSTCRTTGSGFRHPASIALINLSDNPSAVFAYVVNQSNSISKCNVAADGTLSNCQATGNFFDPSDITFNALNTYAYVTDASLNKVLVCKVDPTTGALSACQDAGGSGFNFPYGIVLDKTNTNAYIVNRRGSSVLRCAINSDGTFSSCQLTGSGFSGPTDIALIGLSNSPSTAFVYITNQLNNTVSKCNIAADGTLGDCQVVANDFNIPLAIAFNG